MKFKEIIINRHVFSIYMYKWRERIERKIWENAFPDISMQDKRREAGGDSH